MMNTYCIHFLYVIIITDIEGGGAASQLNFPFLYVLIIKSLSSAAGE